MELNLFHKKIFKKANYASRALLGKLEGSFFGDGSDIKIAIDAFISNGCEKIYCSKQNRKKGGDTWGTIKAYSQQSYSISVFDYILDNKIPNAQNLVSYTIKKQN